MIGPNEIGTSSQTRIAGQSDRKHCKQILFSNSDMGGNDSNVTTD